MTQNAAFQGPKFFNFIPSLFSSPKLILLLLVCFRYPIGKFQQEQGKLEKYYETDAEHFPTFSLSKLNACSYLIDNFEFNFRGFTDIINSLISNKRIHFGKIKNTTERIVVKYSGDNEYIIVIQRGLTSENSQKGIENALKDIFLNTRQQGFYFCPLSAVEMFVTKLSTKIRSRFETWLHLIVDPETVLLPTLNAYDQIGLPTYYNHCGFTLYKSYEGLTLNQLNNRNISYRTKLQIAFQLLSIVVTFTEGFDGYRMYFTDLTLDNIAYNEKSGKLAVIDLDSIVISDSRYNATTGCRDHRLSIKGKILRHEKIECHGCFAYKEEDLCTYNAISDINIFSACQLLNEDLYGDDSKGFLKPIPEHIEEIWPQLEIKLAYCVQCPLSICENRFVIVSDLMNYIGDFLKLTT